MAKTSTKLVTDMARKTGVAEGDVKKILDQLGLSRVHADAVASNKGAEPKLSSAKIAFKIGRSTIVV
jgi:hypothetical protein